MAADPVTVLTALRKSEAETLAALQDLPSWAAVRASYARRIAALDTALAALALVQKLAHARPGSASYVPYEWVGWITEARALLAQETT